MTVADPFLVAADLFDPPETEEGASWARCAADPITFMHRHVTIEEPDGKVIPLRLWPFQADTIRQLHDGKPIVVLKARRLGLSWIVLAYALWLAIFSQGIRILILCKTGDDAAELLDRIRRMRDRLLADPGSRYLFTGLPRPAKARDAVTTLDIGDSTIRALMGTPAAARSETAGMVILDEFAFQRGAGEIWRAILPTIEGGGRLAAISTGNGGEQSEGLGAEFAKQWRRAVAGISGLIPLFFPWHARPDRDEAWKLRTQAELGEPERFKTEYPSEPADAFLSPDADLIYDPTHIAAASKRGAEIDALPERQRPGGPLWMGIDWGVHTHVLFARRTAGGGLYVFHEEVSDRGDLEQVVDQVVAYLKALGEPVAYERFDAAEPIIHNSFRKQFRTKLGYNPRWLAIPFGKYKGIAIKYARMLMRRTYEAADMRAVAISPTGCPELLRQLAVQEWRDADALRTEKGDDHGPDGLLTLTAELAEAHYAKHPND